MGCKLVRQRGDHRIYSREGLIRPIVIPAVKELPIFIIRNNIRVLGLAPEQYIEIIEKL